MKFAMMTVAVLTAAGVVAGADWPCYLGPEGTSASAETGLARSWPADGPKTVWATPLGEGFAGPVAIGGEVYILDRGGEPKKEKDIFRCLSLTDGKETWRYEYDAPGKLSFPGSRSAPAADAKYVFAVGSFGQLSCFDRKEHKLVWQKNLLTEFGGKLPGWGVAMSPLLYKDTVIVTPLGSKAGVAALAKADGKVVWTSESLGRMEYVSPVLATVAGVEQVLVISDGGLVAGVSPADGKVLWTYRGWKCGIPITPPAAVGGGKVFITGGYRAGSAMIEISKDASGAMTAKELFKTQACGAQIHRPVLHKDFLYVNSNDNQRADGLLCMDLTGQVKWKTQRDPNFERGGMLLADGMLVILDGAKGTLFLVDPNPEKFTVLASAKVLETDTAWCPLALTDGKLLVRDQKTLKCLDLKGK